MSDAADKVRGLSERLAMELERIESVEQIDTQLQEMGVETASTDVRYSELAMALADILELIRAEQGILVDKWIEGGGPVATLSRKGRLNRGTLIRRQRELNRRED